MPRTILRPMSRLRTDVNQRASRNMDDAQYAISANEPRTDVQGIYTSTGKRVLRPPRNVPDYSYDERSFPQDYHPGNRTYTPPTPPLRRISPSPMRTSFHEPRHRDMHLDSNDATFYHMEKVARHNESLRRATILYKSTVLFDGHNLSAWKQEFLHVMNEFGLSDVLLRPFEHKAGQCMHP